MNVIDRFNKLTPNRVHNLLIEMYDLTRGINSEYPIQCNEDCDKCIMNFDVEVNSYNPSDSPINQGACYLINQIIEAINKRV